MIQYLCLSKKEQKKKKKKKKTNFMERNLCCLVGTLFTAETLHVKNGFEIIFSFILYILVFIYGKEVARNTYSKCQLSVTYFNY